jgi:hypothetical protein
MREDDFSCGEFLSDEMLSQLADGNVSRGCELILSGGLATGCKLTASSEPTRDGMLSLLGKVTVRAVFLSNRLIDCDAFSSRTLTWSCGGFFEGELTSSDGFI